MNTVTVVTSSACSYCHATKNLLKQQRVNFQEVDLFKDSEQAQQRLIESGQRTVLQLFINEKTMGGLSELPALFANNEFDLSQTPLI